MTPEPEFFDTYTRIDGSFDLPDLQPDQYFVRAEAPGWSPTFTLLDLREARPDELKIILGPLRKVKGHLLDCEQKPVEGVEIVCFLCSYHPLDSIPLDEACEAILFSQSVTTDVKGRFTVNIESPHHGYMIYAEPEGYLPVYSSITSRELDELRLVLRKACILEGRIMDEGGNPLTDAEVYFREPQEPTVRNPVDFIDEEDGFRFDSVPEGYIQLQAIHKEYGHAVADLAIQANKINYHDLKLPKGLKLNIKVMDLDGKPLKGMQVVGKNLELGAFIDNQYTDEQGSVTLCGLNRNQSTYIWVSDPKNKHSSYKKIMTFEKGEDLEIRLPSRPIVPFIVKDASTNELITQYNVCICSFFNACSAEETLSFQKKIIEHKVENPDFKFRIGSNEIFELTFLADGYEPELVMVKHPESETGEAEPIEVLLEPGTILQGTIMNAVSREPIPGATIQLYLNGWFDKKPGHPLSKSRNCISREDGTFSLEGMSHQRFYAKIQAPGFAPNLIDSYRLDHSAPPASNIIHLWPSGSLSGNITSKTGCPLDHATVRVRLENTNELLTTHSFPDGTYRLDGVPPGKLEVTASDYLNQCNHESKMQLIQQINMPPGGRLQADFSFEGPCSVQGMCYIDGQELEGVAIEIIDGGGRVIKTGTSTVTGFYRVYGLDNGDYTLTAHSTLEGVGAVFRKAITFTQGHKKKLDIHFKGIAFSGCVTDASGKPLHSAEVELLTPSFERDFLAYTNENGNYKILNVTEGQYYIVARAPGYGEEMKGPFMLGIPQKHARKVDFLLKPGGALRMHVKSIDGAPLANAKVLLAKNLNKGVLWYGKTRLSGISVFENLQTEPLSALAICKGHAPGSTQLLVQANEITDGVIALQKGGSFTLTVRSINGIPISGASVSLVDFSLLGQTPFRLAQLGLLNPSTPGFTTNEKGGFSLGLLPPGMYNLKITKGKHMMQKALTITPGQDTIVQVTIE